ncbi:MAG: hypothetical protein EOS10_24640 [Mesorhizobium sp.]|uniref:hypothetical protein n=1 Tax=Mesorhizobium sp. TaxID=1871066 RepID=UPI000FEA5C6B|nr:hypothetical protein [Mesorhizobium sp.]RWO28627.1 MAG: hypothetical protein EOS10_24640 [Mesorhizobium sp.]
MLPSVAQGIATLALLVGFSLQVQASNLIPLLTDRWCPGVFLPFGENEVDPSILDKPIENPASIADMPVIIVEITYPDGYCDEACQEKVTLALAQSVNLWRQSCLRCHRGLMAFTVVGETVFIDGQVWVAFTANTSLVEDVLAAHQTLLSLGDGSPTGTGHVMGSYVAAARSDPELTQFCQNDLSGFKGFWPIPLAAAICDGSASLEPPTLGLAFVSHPPCGENAFFACGEPDRRIEMDVTNTRYELRSSPGVGADRVFVLGNPTATMKVDLHAVFLHEVGHFLGLGHVTRTNLRDTFPAVMFHRPDNDLCMTMTDVLMLNSSADQSWAFRARVPEGLVRTELLENEP